MSGLSAPPVVPMTSDSTAERRSATTTNVTMARSEFLIGYSGSIFNPCPPNLPLQPRRLIFAPAAVGCKRLLDSAIKNRW